MEDIDDLLEYLEETPTGFMCCFCSKKYDGSLERIKWHLAKIEGYGIDICPEVDEDDSKRVREDYCYPKPPPRSRKRACISTDLPSRKRERGLNGDARNVVANVNTLGVHLLTSSTEVVDKQFDECIDDIWSCLMDDDNDDVFTIGIYGIGGVGKTEVAKCINNKLLCNPNKFHHVFWVNVSPVWSIHNLQSRISKAVGVDLSDGDGEIKRAAQLSKGLAEKNKSFLILDDVWDYISLQEVGIPLGVDLCTVAFTTRSLQVCRQLGCQRKIEIQCLLPHEGYELFKRNLGEETTLSREVEEVSRLVSDKCSGVPLAITITARNMKGVTDIRQWRNALRGDTRNKADMEIFRRLKLSYDYLKDSTLQHCFLYCTSIAKEVKGGKYRIGEKMLVEYLVDEGIIKRMNSRREQLDDAHAKLNFLADVGLLKIYSHKFVEVNALIWRMGLQIMEENNQRSIVKNCKSLKDIPDEESWTGDLVRVSLECRGIKNIRLDFSPSCSKLSMLLLNLFDGNIRDSFFEGMPRLKVLDLSYTGISSLPSSIYGLVNLTTLILRSCSNLRKFPNVAKLRALKKLDLSFSAVQEVADEAVQMPPKLAYLDLFCTEVKLNPRILAQLSHLQFLRLPWGSGVTAEELSCLSRLETLVCYMNDVVELKKYLVHIQWFKERGSRVQLDVKVGPGAIWQGLFGTDLIYDYYGHWIAIEDIDLSKVVFNDCNINEMDLLIYFQYIAIVKCHGPRSLCNFSPIKGATKLKYFSIRHCDELELLCSVSSPGQGILENLEYMELFDLKNLNTLFSKEGNFAYGSCFSNLTRLLIQGCPNIKRLLPIEILPNLKNLQRLYVLDCLSMEEIFAAEEEEKEEESSSMDEMEKVFCLSRLCIFMLKDLPELKRVCCGRFTFVIPGSCSPEYTNCPKLVLDDHGDNRGQ